MSPQLSNFVLAPWNNTTRTLTNSMTKLISLIKLYSYSFNLIICINYSYLIHLYSFSNWIFCMTKKLFTKWKIIFNISLFSNKYFQNIHNVHWNIHFNTHAAQKIQTKFGDLKLLTHVILRNTSMIRIKITFQALPLKRKQ